MIGRTNCGAGGGSLNFSIVGGTTQPLNPKTNTVWVKTSAAITGYAFSADAPASPAEGNVWIAVSTLGLVKFSITKKNPIMVYPAVANQFTNGAWVRRDLAVFYDSTWHSGLVTMFPNSSVEWASAVYSTISTKGDVTIAADYIEMHNSWTNTQNYQMAYTTTRIDVTPFSQLCVTIRPDSDEGLTKTFGLTTAPSGSESVSSFEVSASTTAASGTIVVDIAAISGVRYIKLHQTRGSADENRRTYITNVYLQ